jgi:hypothetical protein
MNKPRVKQTKMDVLSFLQRSLSDKSTYIPRDDYRELMELCVMFLGILPKRNFTFKSPGPCHHARWMAKIIYSFKVYLFRLEFHLTEKEENDLKELCLFYSLVYVKTWVSCPIPVDAPLNDLNFYKELIKYKKINSTIAIATAAKFQRHLWYLRAEVMPLLLFSKKLTVFQKVELQNEIKKYEGDWSQRDVQLKKMGKLEKRTICSFVGAASICGLRTLGINTEFILNSDPATWNNSPEYEANESIIMALKVVNDCAERGVKLMSKYNTSRTKDELQLQNILHVVEDHCKRVPNANKKTIIKYNPR